MPRSAAKAREDGSRMPGPRRPVRTASRSAVSRPRRTRDPCGPGRSRCRSTLAFPACPGILAQDSSIEVDLILGRLPAVRSVYDSDERNDADTGPAGLRRLRRGFRPRDVAPGPSRDQGTRQGPDRSPAPRADPDPRLAAQRLRPPHRHPHQGRARDRRDRREFDHDKGETLRAAAVRGRQTAGRRPGAHRAGGAAGIRASCSGAAAAVSAGAGPRRWWVLAVLCLSVLLVVVDNTIVNVALPTISRKLSASTQDLQWVVDAYTLVFAALLLVGGNLGDRIGRRRILRVGLVLFAVTSAGAALSRTSGELIAGRAAMGAAAALIYPATLALLTATFAEPRERATAIGVWSAVAGLAVAIGPVSGGLLLRHFSWRSVFF